MKKCDRPVTGIKVSIALVILILFPALCQVTGQEVVKLSASGWTIKADPDRKQLTIVHDSLGVLLAEVNLNTMDQNGIKPITDWASVKKDEGQIEIQTQHPSTFWIFRPAPNDLMISATSADLAITGKAPASSGRITARLIDRSGTPVNWRGTEEITVSWNGKDTQNPSALPAVNPEVMTFALGNISANNLHSLFDCSRDIAISFSDQTLMKRNPENPEQLDVTMRVPGSTIIRLIPDYYTKQLGLPVYQKFDDSIFRTAPLIWGSWTAYYNDARESDIISNTDWIAKNLKPYGFQYVQLDDGYDRSKEGHNWIGPWNKSLFPHGPEWLARYIKSKGLKPGLWLVPNSYAGAFKQHPDWYLYDRAGKVISDYSTPALDHTNPAVQEWLTRLFTTLRGWGFEYFKFDGELSLPLNVPDIDMSRIYNKNIDPFTAYRERLRLIRNVIGPGTFVEGCVAGTPLNGIGYFNSCFNGADMYNSWKGSYAVFSSINANAFLNHIVIYVMPGEGIDVSPLMSVEEAKQKMDPRTIEVALSREDPFTGFGTTLPEARTLVSIISMTGVAYPLTSIMPRLPDERVRLLKMTMPTMPVLPVDLYSRGSDITWDKFKFTTPDTYIHNYPEIIDLKVNSVSGTYDVAAFTNWRGERALRSVSFADKLGLEKSTSYVVFDFWNQKLAGVFKNMMDIEIDPHDTRVFLIHPLQANPQLIGNSRHISGAFSILDLKWDASNKILGGKSETIIGDPYSLFVYVPDGMTLTGIKAFTQENKEVIAGKEQSGNLLKITFENAPGAVKWQLHFQ